MSHSMMVILGGFILFAVFVFTGKAEQRSTNALRFIPMWFALALANLLIGVYWAGYSFGLEAQVFLMVFGVPAAVALASSRLLRR